VRQWIKQLLCWHDYEACPYRALNVPNEVTYVCRKCAKRDKYIKCED